MKNRTKDDRWFNSIINVYNECKYVCKHCGHKQIIMENKEKEICDECGYYVFKNDKDEFIFRLKEAQNSKKVFDKIKQI